MSRYVPAYACKPSGPASSLLGWSSKNPDYLKGLRDGFELAKPTSQTIYYRAGYDAGADDRFAQYD
jgi:hypothetical protein